MPPSDVAVEHAEGSPATSPVLWPIALCFLLVWAFAVCWLLNLDRKFGDDYDEGVYLCSARMLLHGHPLFTAVFSSQPPAFVEILTLAFAVLGDSVIVGRAVIVFFALVSLAAIAWIASRLVSPFAGPVAILALGLPLLYLHQARRVQAEIPALAFALLALGALLSWRCGFRPTEAAGVSDVRAASGRWRFAWVLAAGFFLGIAICCKLLVVPMLLPAALLLVPAPEPGKTRLGALFSRTFVLGVLLFGLGGILAAAAAAAPWNPTALWDQAIAFHLRAKTEFPSDWPGNFRAIVAALGDDLAISGCAALGLLVLAWHRPSAFLWLGAWLLVSFLFLLDHTPLFPRHVLLLLAPLAVAASANVMWLPVLWRFTWGHPVVFACLLPLIWLLGTVMVRDVQALWRVQPTPASESETVLLMKQLAKPEDYVVSDQQMQIYRAGRLTPPQMCDTSFVRIHSGYLTDDEATAASQEARLIVFWTRRLEQLPRFSAWVKANYRLLRTFDGGGKKVYLRK